MSVPAIEKIIIFASDTRIRSNTITHWPLKRRATVYCLWRRFYIVRSGDRVVKGMVKMRIAEILDRGIEGRRSIRGPGGEWDLITEILKPDDDRFIDAWCRQFSGEGRVWIDKEALRAETAATYRKLAVASRGMKINERRGGRG